jgi:wyosine [tRNA(Phe)-imidazoG37] synthetase (radical SAM superfamily)
MNTSRKSHVYGPVPSRRLGRSLGVDLVPFKTCSYDCIYCQLGATTAKTITRRDYVPVDEIIEDVEAELKGGAQPDFITLAGSGEPTLHLYLDEIILRVRSLSDVPIALLTNGSLFYRECVRRDAALADFVLPSLDAPNARLFRRMNRPHPNIGFKQVVQGLEQFRREYAGQLWLEVLLLKGFNDSDEEVKEFNKHIERIRPDRIHLNTAVRPPAETNALCLPPEDMSRLCKLFGPKASVAAGFQDVHMRHKFKATRDQVLNLLARRPCTLDDMANGLSLHVNEATKHVDALLAEGQIVVQRQGSKVYYQAESADQICGKSQAAL